MTLYDKIDRYKASIDEHRPFEGHLLNEIKGYYRIGLTWSSNALEGNTLTISETKVLLEDGLTVGGKGSRRITEADALTMHRMFYTGIDAKEAGHYRDRPVFIAGSQYKVCDVKLIGHEMAKLFQWVAEKRDKYHPVKFAAQLHKRFVFIHPFIDGNGRISRLLMNTALIQDGYMLAVIPPVLRQEYNSLLERAHKDDRPFMDFIAERVYETQKEIMRLLHIPFPKMT